MIAPYKGLFLSSQEVKWKWRIVRDLFCNDTHKMCEIHLTNQCQIKINKLMSIWFNLLSYIFLQMITFWESHYPFSKCQSAVGIISTSLYSFCCYFIWSISHCFTCSLRPVLFTSFLVQMDNNHELCIDCQYKYHNHCSFIFWLLKHKILLW